MEALLSPDNLAELCASFAGKHYFYEKGPPSRWDRFFSLENLNQLLELSVPAPERIRVVKRGLLLPRQSFVTSLVHRGKPEVITRLNSDAIRRLLNDGATISVRGADDLHRPLRELAESVERALPCRVQINLYYSCGTDPGFFPHYDDHDSFVLQIAGSKCWSVFDGPMERALEAQDSTSQHPPTQTLWKGLMESGDVLYLPRGFWHSAVAIGEPVLHATVGIYKLTGIDAVMALLAYASNVTMFREDLPTLPSTETREEHLAKLLDNVTAYWRTHLLGDLEKRAASTRNSRPHFNVCAGDNRLEETLDPMTGGPVALR